MADHLGGKLCRGKKTLVLSSRKWILQALGILRQEMFRVESANLSRIYFYQGAITPAPFVHLPVCKLTLPSITRC